LREATRNKQKGTDMKDWTGNAKSIFVCNGASNHSEDERQNEDYYATEPRALEILLEVEEFSPYIWECACGGGHLSQVLADKGFKVKSSDIYDRGYEGTEIIDFLKVTKEDVKNDFPRDIITNPPYKFAKEFVEKALDISMDSTKIAMFLKLTFLESKARKALFEKYPPKVIYVSSSRLQCAKNGDFEKYGKGVGTAVAYAWYVWEKGFKGEPVVRWVN
jgi:hypothetical protein